MIFIDACAWVAYFSPSDQNHAIARAAWQELPEQGPLLTSVQVLAEALSLIARYGGYPHAVRQAQAIYASKQLQILRSREAEERRAIDLFRKYGEHRIGFTDCISFAMLENRGVRRVFTFDRDFAIAGFILWPGDEA